MLHQANSTKRLAAPGTVLMVGTSLETMGGISAAVRVWREAGLFQREAVTYVATHRDGGKWAKLGAMAIGVARFVRLAHQQPRPRLVHLHLSRGASFWRKALVARIATSLGIPYIAHLHSSGFPQYYSAGRALRRQAIRCMFDEAALVIALSSHWAECIRTMSSNPAIEVVANAVAVTEPDAQLTPTPLSGRILFLGRMGQGKGTFDLLDAFAKVIVCHPHASLHIGGDGDAGSVMQRIDQLGLQDHVRLLGWVRGADKASELSQASVYVLPSYNEGLPMSVLEAMAAGLPVVSTPVGGIPDAVLEGEQGFLVQPGDVAALADRLGRLLGDEGLRRRMGAAAQQRVRQHFSADAAVQRLGELYRQVERVAGSDRH